MTFNIEHVTPGESNSSDANLLQISCQNEDMPAPGDMGPGGHRGIRRAVPETSPSDYDNELRLPSGRVDAPKMAARLKE